MIDFKDTNVDNGVVNINIGVEKNPCYTDIYLKTFHIYTPEGYAKGKRSYPILEDDDLSTTESEETVTKNFYEVIHSLTSNSLDVALALSLGNIVLQFKKIPVDITSLWEFVFKYTYKVNGYTVNHNLDENETDNWAAHTEYTVNEVQYTVLSLKDRLSLYYIKPALIEDYFYIGIYEAETDLNPTYVMLESFLTGVGQDIYDYTEFKDFIEGSSEHLVVKNDSTGMVITRANIQSGVGEELNAPILNFYAAQTDNYTTTQEEETIIIEREYPKDYQITLYPGDLRDPDNILKTIDVDKTLLIIEVEVTGTPAADCPCGADKTKETTAIYYKKPIYRQAIKYLNRLEGCTPNRDFVDFMLRLKALDLSILACNYTQAANLYQYFIKNTSNKTISNCGCHG